jgi:tetratricopeptide (TPR) repeat protein
LNGFNDALVVEMEEMIKKIAAIFITLILLLQSTACNGETKISEKLELANKYLLEQNYEQAIVAFNEVIKIDPKVVEAYQGLADAYNALGKPEEAEKILLAGIKAVDDKDPLRISLGDFYFDQLAYEKALGIYEKIEDSTKVSSSVKEKIKKCKEEKTVLPYGEKDGDYKLADIMLCMDVRDVKDLLGEPLSYETLGTNYHIMHYDFGEVNYDEVGKVRYISVTTAQYSGPRETYVGDEISSVISKFPNEKKQIENGVEVLFGEYTPGNFWGQKFGILEYDQNGEISDLMLSMGILDTFKYSYNGLQFIVSGSILYKVNNGKVSKIVYFNLADMND